MAMISSRARGLQLLHFAIQTLLAVFLFWGWFFINFFIVRDGGGSDLRRYVIYCGLVVLGATVDFVRWNPVSDQLLDLCPARNRYLCLRQMFTIVGLITVYLVGAKDQFISRVFLFSYLPTLFVMLFWTNRVGPRLLASFVFQAKRRQRTVVLGSVASASKLQGWLQSKIAYGMDTVGLVSTKRICDDVAGIPLLGSVRDLETILAESRASQLLVTETPETPGEIARLAGLCDRLGVRLLILNDLEEKIGRPVSLVEDCGFRFLSLRHEPLECPFNQIIKRGLDIAIALPVVLFILPITSAIVAICHRLQSPGPLIFEQRRRGINGEEFWIYKYRTMQVAAHDESVQASRVDSRVFKAGALLRKLSVDELPQFLNVLKGNMSIVGPRPHMTAHDDQFSTVAHSYRIRSFIKPGITGLAQVEGFRGEVVREEDMAKRVESDLFYLEHWSFFMDARIIFRTALQVIVPPRTAY